MSNDQNDSKLDDPHDYDTGGDHYTNSGDESSTSEGDGDDEQTDSGGERTEAQTFSGDGETASSVSTGLNGSISEGPQATKSTSSSGSGGLITNGITTTEAAVMIGVTAISYAMAYGVLLQMSSHGLHHAPIQLWVVFGILVIIPLGLMYGSGFFTRLMSTYRESQSNNTQHNRSG